MREEGVDQFAGDRHALGRHLRLVGAGGRHAVADLLADGHAGELVVQVLGVAVRDQRVDAGEDRDAQRPGGVDGPAEGGTSKTAWVMANWAPRSTFFARRLTSTSMLRTLGL